MKFSQQLKAALLALFATSQALTCMPVQAATAKPNLADPQEGYLAAWRFVRDSYVDASFGGQDWSAWEHKFKIQTREDEFQAIKIMMESLHDPYTRPQHPAGKGAESGSKVSTSASESGGAAVSSKLMEHEVGYIKIAGFDSPYCADEVKASLQALSNAKTIMLDLRGNQGGLVSNALEIADMFLNCEDIITTVSRDGRHTYSASGAPISRQPLVILVDSQTASASEILTAALKDNHRATVVGTRTFGKGLVQEIALLPGVVLRCTVSGYLTPNGSDINKVGLLPDLDCSNEADSLKVAMDYLAKTGISAVPPEHVCHEIISAQRNGHS